MGSKNLTVVAYARAKPGKEEEVCKELMHLVTETHKEPGCVNYDMHVNLDDKGYFIFYENWRTREEWEQHMKMPYLEKWINELAPELCTEAPDITLWEMVDPEEG